jgi:hypothetical protein
MEIDDDDGCEDDHDYDDVYADYVMVMMMM